MFKKVLVVCMFLLLATNILKAAEINYSLLSAQVQAYEDEDSNDAFYVFKTDYNLGEKQLKLALASLRGQKAAFDVYIDDNGMLGHIDSHHPIRLGFARKDFLDGEPVKFRLYQANSDLVATTSIIPFRLMATDLKGHTIEMVIEDKNAKNYLLIGSGFRPHEKVRGCLKIGRECTTQSTEATEEGYIFIKIIPTCIGKTGGKGSMNIWGEDSSLMTIPFCWGKKALKIH